MLEVVLEAESGLNGLKFIIGGCEDVDPTSSDGGIGACGKGGVCNPA